MATQVPILQRDENAPEQASVGRVDYNAPNIPGLIQQRDQDIQGAANSAATYVKAQQTFAAQNKANQDAMAMHGEIDREFNGDPGGTNPDGTIRSPTIGAKQKAQNGSDPAPIFADFNAKVNAINATYTDANKNADPVTQSLSNRMRNQVLNRFQQQSSTAYGIANVDYINKTSDGLTKMAQQDVSNAMPNLNHIMSDDIENPDVTNPIDKALDDIHTAIGHKGLQLGGANAVVPDVNDKDPATEMPKITGYTLTSPALQAEEQQKKSSAVSEAVKSILIPGQTDLNQVKYMMDNYGDQLDAKDKPAIMKEVAKATEQQSGEDLFNDNKGLEYPTMVANIQSAKGISDQARDYAMAKAVTYKTQMMAMNDAREKQGLIAAGQIIHSKTVGGQPFVTPEQMESDPAISKIITEAQLTPEHINALRSMVKPQKESDPDALANAQAIMKDPQKMKSMGTADIIQATSGLNEKDQNAFRSHVGAYQNVTPGELDKQKTSMMKYAEQQLLDLGNAGDRDIGIKEMQNKKGQYNTKDQVKLNTFTNSILSDSDNFNLMSSKDQQQYINDKIVKMVQDKPKDTGFFHNLFNNDNNVNNWIKSHSAPAGTPSKASGSAAPAPVPSTSSVPGVASSQSVMQIRTDAAIRYVKQFGKKPDLTTDAGKAEFLKFMNGK